MTQQEAKAIVYWDKGDYNFPVKEIKKQTLINLF